MLSVDFYADLLKKVAPDWYEVLQAEFNKAYFRQLQDFLLKEQGHAHRILPHINEIFTAFALTRLKDIKVVILGQDPYPNPNFAHGLAFSSKHQGIPASLRNMYKELNTDLGYKIPNHANLSAWAKQGVFLLNTVLTVRAEQSNSHRNQGWEYFTNAVIKLLNETQKHLVFMLWGRQAIDKQNLLDKRNHLVLTSTHPSPLSAHRGFMGCKHFSQCNTLLKTWNKPEINWQIT